MLAAQPEPAIPAGLFERIDQTLQAQRKPIMPLKLLYRVAAVLIFGFIAVAVVQTVHNPQSPIEPPRIAEVNGDNDLYSNELDMWEVALTQEEVLSGADEETLTEILVLWDDEGWEMEKLIGKEGNDESDNFTADDFVGIWSV